MSALSTLLSIIATVAYLQLEGGDCTPTSHYEVVPFSRQCNVNNSTKYPHIRYDADRGTLAKIYDGLNLQYRMLVNAMDADGGDRQKYMPQVEGFFSADFTREDLKKLIKVIQQRNLIKALDSAERKEFSTVMGVLDVMADEMCELLQTRLQNRYKSFTCSDSELLDMQSRLEHADLVQNVIRTIEGDTSNSVNRGYDGECSYWNTRMLKNCRSGDPVEQEVGFVHHDVIKPFYIDSECTCTDNVPLCELEATPTTARDP